MNAELVRLATTGRCAFTKDGGVLRSNSCSYVASLNSKHGICGACYKTLGNLKKRSHTTKPEKIAIVKRKLSNANKKNPTHEV